VKDNLGFSF